MLRNKIEDMNEKFKRFLKKQILEIKYSLNEMENAFKSFNNRLDQAEKWIPDPEEITFKIT